MNFTSIFGFEKKRRTPFRIPREISDLRTRIEAENRENYPSLRRYNEIMNDLPLVKNTLNALIAEKEHADEAIRVREDIRRKIELLTKKIRNNAREAMKENKQDFMESNFDYLERKSARITVKTLYAEFLEAAHVFEQFCKDGTLESGKTIGSATANLFKAISTLNNDFFKVYGKDDEIQEIRDKALQHLSGLRAEYRMNTSRFQKKELAAYIDASMRHLLG